MKKSFLSVALFLVLATPVGAQTTGVRSGVPATMSQKPAIRAQVNEVRKEVKAEIKDVRQNVRQEVKDVRQNVREDVREVRANTKETVQNAKEAIRANAQEIKGAIQDKRAELKANIEQKREELQKKVEAKREETKKIIEDKRMEMQKKIEAQKTELKTRLLKIKDEAKKQAVERIAEGVNNLNKQRTNHFAVVLEQLDKVLANISARADKAEGAGKIVASVRTAITEANSAISSARTVVQAQAGKVYALTINTEDKLRADVEVTRKALQDDLNKVQEAVKNARDTVHKAAVALAQIPRVNEEVESENGATTTTSTAPVSGSTSTTTQ